jgi:sugar lactone lactonase YvrE
VKRCVERAFVGLAIVAVVIGGVAAWEAWGGGKMYRTDLGIDKIQRVGMDGTGMEDLITTDLIAPRGIAIDMVGGKMYWTDSGTLKIRRANLDGSNTEDLIARGLSAPGGIALDGVGGKMYWTDSATGKIQRANLDGTSVEDLIITYSSGPMSGGGQRYGIALETTR